MQMPSNNLKRKVRTAAAIILACATTGCTVFTVNQDSQKSDGSTTAAKIRAFALLSSSQALERIKSQQSNQTQSFGVEAVSQQGGTNTAAIIEAIAKIVSLAK